MIYRDLFNIYRDLKMIYRDPFNIYRVLKMIYRDLFDIYRVLKMIYRTGGEEKRSIKEQKTAVSVKLCY
jgi:hypothetical protein